MKNASKVQVVLVPWIQHHGSEGHEEAIKILEKLPKGAIVLFEATPTTVQTLVSSAETPRERARREFHSTSTTKGHQILPLEPERTPKLVAKRESEKDLAKVYAWERKRHKEMLKTIIAHAGNGKKTVFVFLEPAHLMPLAEKIRKSGISVMLNKPKSNKALVEQAASHSSEAHRMAREGAKHAELSVPWFAAEAARAHAIARRPHAR